MFPLLLNSSLLTSFKHSASSHPIESFSKFCNRATPPLRALTERNNKISYYFIIRPFHNIYWPLVLEQRIACEHASAFHCRTRPTFERKAEQPNKRKKRSRLSFHRFCGFDSLGSELLGASDFLVTSTVLFMLFWSGSLPLGEPPTGLENII